jgi:hypothetical protein
VTGRKTRGSGLLVRRPTRLMKYIDSPRLPGYRLHRDIQEARLLITISRLVPAVLAVLSSSLKFLSLRNGVCFYFKELPWIPVL